MRKINLLENVELEISKQKGLWVSGNLCRIEDDYGNLLQLLFIRKDREEKGSILSVGCCRRSGVYVVVCCRLADLRTMWLLRLRRLPPGGPPAGDLGGALISLTLLPSASSGLYWLCLNVYHLICKSLVSGTGGPPHQHRPRHHHRSIGFRRNQYFHRVHFLRYYTYYILYM